MIVGVTQIEVSKLRRVASPGLTFIVYCLTAGQTAKLENSFYFNTSFCLGWINSAKIE